MRAKRILAIVALTAAALAVAGSQIVSYVEAAGGCPKGQVACRNCDGSFAYCARSYAFCPECPAP
jgi:hypothetical protein